MYLSIPTVFILTLIFSSTTQALVRSDGTTGKLPALGWNSWNAYYCDINSTKILAAANLVVSLGLKDAGYEYVNIDDCWSVKSGRDSVTQRIVPDPDKFPDGIKGIADSLHALGLKAGIYSSAGTETCAGYPASIGYESLDAATFASWGIDYLKYDNCYVPANWTDQYVACVPDQWDLYGPFPNGTCAVTDTTAPASYNWGTSNTAKRYGIMRDALLAQNRTILYSLCEWGQADVEAWGNSTGNSWRITGDIQPWWARVAEILNEASFREGSTGFWGHNDADMLEIGDGNLTVAESRSHFAFWAAMKSPLIIGTDLSTLEDELVDVLKNKALLAFSQDKLIGQPATPYKWGINPDWTFNYTNPAEYWSGKYGNGDVLVLALNSELGNNTRTISWKEVPELNEGKLNGAENGGKEGAYEVTDVWTGRILGCIRGGVERVLEEHDTFGVVVGGAC